MLVDLKNPSKHILLKQSFFYKDYLKVDKFPKFWTKIKKNLNNIIPENTICLSGIFIAKSKYLGRKV